MFGRVSLDGAVIPNYPASSQDQAMTLGFERKGEQQRGRELRLRLRVVDGVERQSGFLAAAHDACMRMSREQTSFVACKGLPVPARGTILQIPLPSGLLGKPKWLSMARIAAKRRERLRQRRTVRPLHRECARDSRFV